MVGNLSKLDGVGKAQTDTHWKEYNSKQLKTDVSIVNLLVIKLRKPRLLK